MIYYIDCEWNGMGGELISIALVPRDKELAEFYRVSASRDYHQYDPWVEEHARPFIEDEPAHDLRTIQNDLESYLAQHSSAHIVADWPEDIARFCMLLITGPGTRINTPALTMEVIRVDAPSEKPHHALYDARGFRDFILNRTW